MNLQQTAIRKLPAPKERSDFYLTLGKFEHFAETLPHIAWTARLDGSTEFCNQRWYEFTGVPRGVPITTTWRGLIHPEDLERVWTQWHRETQREQEFEITYRLRHHSGEYRWVSAKASPVRDEQGEVKAWCGLSTDIHELVAAQAHAESEQRLVTDQELMAAISHEQIFPIYQPKVCLATGKTIGFEALARWRHPSKGVLTPADFGFAFEQAGLAKVIGKVLIRKVAADIRCWLDADCDPGRVAINLSSDEFCQPDLADEVLDILQLAEVPAKHFEVEVTEKVLFEGRSGLVTGTLEKFRRRGVQIALDDFGTGYASLTHLKVFPVDHIKIDQSFVSGLEHKEDDAAIVSAVIFLGKRLGLIVTAEGVETEGQVLRLRDMGCDAAQGYLYARPMPGSEVSGFLRSRSRHRG